MYKGVGEIFLSYGNKTDRIFTNVQANVVSLQRVLTKNSMGRKISLNNVWQVLSGQIADSRKWLAERLYEPVLQEEQGEACHTGCGSFQISGFRP